MLLVSTLLEATLASVRLDTLGMESTVQVSIYCFVNNYLWPSCTVHDKRRKKRRTYIDLPSVNVTLETAADY